MKYLMTIIILALTACSQSENPKGQSELQTDKLLSVASVDLSPKKGTGRWYTESQLSEGQETYAQYCSGCHGQNAESVKDWKKLDANDNYPPPPLNGSAHAWHHPLSIMDKVIRDGGKPLGGQMPAWEGVLTEDQRLKAVASFQNYWTDEIYEMWLERENLNREE